MNIQVVMNLATCDDDKSVFTLLYKCMCRMLLVKRLTSAKNVSWNPRCVPKRPPLVSSYMSMSNTVKFITHIRPYSRRVIQVLSEPSVHSQKTRLMPQLFVDFYSVQSHYKLTDHTLQFITAYSGFITTQSVYHSPLKQALPLMDEDMGIPAKKEPRLC